MDKYTIYQVADILKTSHTTIYNKLNNKEICKELRNFIIKCGKVRYVSEEGVEPGFAVNGHMQLTELVQAVDGG